MRSDLARSVDLARGPLFGFALFKASDNRFFWYARYHHIIMDGYGMWLVAHRLAQIYSQLSDGRAIDQGSLGSLPSLLEENASYRSSEGFERDRRFWKDYLAGATGAARFKGRASQVGNGFVRRTLELPKTTADEIRALAQRPGSRLSDLISSVTAILLHRVTGADDLVFGLAVAARTDVTRMTPGAVSNVMPVRLAVQAGMTVAEIIAQASRQIRRSLDHQHYQFTDLRKELGMDGPTFYGVGVNVMRFNYGFRFAGNRATAYNLSLGPVDELSIVVYDRADGGTLRIDFDGNSELFTAADLEEVQRRFLRILEAAVTKPDRAHWAARHTRRCRAADHPLRDWNDTVQPIAVCDGGGAVCGAGGANPRSGCGGVRGTAADLFGSLKSAPTDWPIICAASASGPGRGRAVRRAFAADGCGSARHPQGRRRLSAARSRLSTGTSGLHAGGFPGASAADAISAFVDELPAYGLRIVELDTDWPAIARQPASAPPNTITPPNTAYVIYTSGSTGIPKGVAVSHAGIPNLAAAQIDRFAISREAAVLQFASLGFDAAVSEIATVLTDGARLVLRTDHSGGQRLANLIRTHGVTHATLPPVVLADLPADLPLGTLIVAGEVLRPIWFSGGRSAGA